MEGTVRQTSFAKSRRFYLAATLLIIALAATGWYGVSYYLQKQSSNQSASLPCKDLSASKTNASANAGVNSVSVNVLFNCGSGTMIWSNSTRFPSGWSFYNVTVLLTNGRLDAPASSYGHFVKAIDGVSANDKSYWAFWIHCTKDNAWTLSPVGADDLTIGANGVYVASSSGQSFLSSNALAWNLQSLSDSNPPVPGAATVEKCSS
jgi:hypothetical protein